MRNLVPHRRRRQVLAVLIGITVSFALTLFSLPNAQGMTPPSGQMAPSGTTAHHDPPVGSVQAAAVIKDKIKFGTATLRAAKQAARIARRAMSKSGRTLNYAEATKVGGRAKWRRQFTAGFYWQGGRVTHISDAELAEVKSFIPPSQAVITQRAPNCQGVNKTVVVRHDARRRIVDTYYDSCETLDLIFAREEAAIVVCGIGSGTAGLVSLVKTIPKLKEAIFAFTALCLFYSQHDLGKLKKAVAKSTLGALIVRSDGTWHSAPKGDAGYYSTVRYYPQ
jgi:hypothetical protein